MAYDDGIHLVEAAFELAPNLGQEALERHVRQGALHGLLAVDAMRDGIRGRGAIDHRATRAVGHAHLAERPREALGARGVASIDPTAAAGRAAVARRLRAVRRRVRAAPHVERVFQCSPVADEEVELVERGAAVTYCTPGTRLAISSRSASMATRCG